tara:strand:+ start:61 stop:174 length:114 start_codon:yes stop_codon:yes gene_type:complete
MTFGLLCLGKIVAVSQKEGAMLPEGQFYRDTHQIYYL